MTERATTEVYYGKGSVGDRHWVAGQAYPPEAKEHYATQRVMDFHVDAQAIYGGATATTDEWGVMVSDPPEGESAYFNVDIPPALAHEDQYGHLVEAVEARLGRTGLMMLVY